MIIVEKTSGQKITYKINGNKITFGNDEMTVNIESRERDHAMQIDICTDKDNCLATGVNENTRKYVAQVDIPAREYDYIEDGLDENGQAKGMEMPVTFDIEKCTLSLWGMEE